MRGEPLRPSLPAVGRLLRGALARIPRAARAIPRAAQVAGDRDGAHIRRSARALRLRRRRVHAAHRSEHGDHNDGAAAGHEPRPDARSRSSDRGTPARPSRGGGGHGQGGRPAARRRGRRYRGAARRPVEALDARGGVRRHPAERARRNPGRRHQGHDGRRRHRRGRVGPRHRGALVRSGGARDGRGLHLRRFPAGTRTRRDPDEPRGGKARDRRAAPAPPARGSGAHGGRDGFHHAGGVRGDRRRRLP